MRDIKDEKFALLVDESTDVSAEKHLCIVIRYYSKKEKRIATELVGLVSVTEATGEALFNAIKAAVEDIGQSLRNCLGFASDGASVMVGNNSYVWTRIQEESPNCIQMRCICHSLPLVCNIPSINYHHTWASCYQKSQSGFQKVPLGEMLTSLSLM